VVVNAHGGLLMLKHEIDNGDILVLTNSERLEDQECRVGYALALLLVGCVLWQAGCASAGSSKPLSRTIGTPAGTYAVTVTATADAAEQTASVTLVVQ
jgi:hypothetical protein